MHRRGENNPTRFASFSGIDGAGKSTQIEALRVRLEEMGLRVRVITFWDEVAKLTGIREGAGHTLFRGDKGVGTPAAPINRRDKNVRSWLLSCVRLGMYFLDAMSVRRVTVQASRSGVDFVIFDRYIYDELANLTLRNPFMRAYVRMMMSLVPKPQISYLLDADPVQARARKPEYPLEFLYANRQSYLDLSALIGGMTVIAPMPVEDVKREVLRHAMREMSFDAGRPEKNAQGAGAEEFGGEPAKLDGPYTRPAAS
jgi:thymidylate kinase